MQREGMTDKKKPFTDVKGKRETSMHQPDIEGERSWYGGRSEKGLSYLLPDILPGMYCRACT